MGSSPLSSTFTRIEHCPNVEYWVGVSETKGKTVVTQEDRIKRLKSGVHSLCCSLCGYYDHLIFYSAGGPVHPEGTVVWLVGSFEMR